MAFFRNFILRYEKRRFNRRKSLPGRRSDPSRKRRWASRAESKKIQDKATEGVFPGSSDVETCHATGHSSEPEMRVDDRCSFCRKPSSRGHTKYPPSSYGPHFMCMRCDRWFATFGPEPESKKYQYCIYCSLSGLPVEYKDISDTNKISNKTEMTIVKLFEPEEVNPNNDFEGWYT